MSLEANRESCLSAGERSGRGRGTLRWGAVCLLPLLGTLSLSGVAHAEEGFQPRVWVAPTSHDGSAVARLSARKFDQEFRQRLATSRRVEMIREEQERRIRAGQPDPRLVKAEAYKHSAIEAFRAENYDESWRLLEASIDLFKASVASIQVVDALFHAYALQMQVALAREYDEDARIIARQLVAIMPTDAELPDFINEDTRRQIARQRRRLRRKRPGSLEVTTTPPGAELLIDGRVVCPETPCTVNELIRGEHFLQARHPEAGIAGAVMPVKGGWSREVALTLEQEILLNASQPVPVALQSRLATESGAGRLGQAFRAAAEEIAVQQDANFVLTPILVQAGSQLLMTAFLYNASSKQTIAFEESRFSQSISAVQMQAFNLIPKVEEAINAFPADRALDDDFPPLVAVLRGPPVAAAPSPRPQAPAPTPVASAPPPRELIQQTPPADVVPAPAERGGDVAAAPSDSFYQKWWFWGSVGGVVVTGAIVAAILATQSGSDETVKTYSSEVLW